MEATARGMCPSSTWNFLHSLSAVKDTGHVQSSVRVYVLVLLVVVVVVVRAAAAAEVVVVVVLIVVLVVGDIVGDDVSQRQGPGDSARPERLGWDLHRGRGVCACVYCIL